MARVDIHYFEQALACATRQGQRREEILKQLSINLAPNAQHVDDQHMTRLVQYVWASLEDEFLGCCAVPCKLGVFPFMARHILNYQRLGDMLEHAITFYGLVTNEVEMKLTRKGNIAELEFNFASPQHDPGYFFREFWLVIWHRFSSWLIDSKIPLTRVCFNYDKPAHHQQLKLLFPCRHSFNRSSIKFSFSAKYLEMHCTRTQSQLTNFLRRSPADLITIAGEEISVRAQVRAMLINQEHDVLVCPSIEKVAVVLNISSQTLRRRLKVESTSYPTIKDEVRFELATQYLRSGKLSVAQIADRLGFSEARSFTRAFKQWSGVSPSKFK